MTKRKKRRTGDRWAPEVRADSALAFLPVPEGRPMRSSDDLAEQLGEAFVEAATTGEEAASAHEEQVAPEEIGGPFVETTAGDEYATTTDDMNPRNAPREPFPKT